MLLASVSLFAQTNVSGVVTGADGVQIPGVAVLIQGTKTGQATGIDGRYSINVSGKNPVLEISCIGYVTQEIPVNGRSVIDVVLEEENRKLKQMYANLALDNRILKEVIEKKL